MSHYWFNVPTLLLGLIAGVFLPVSRWMLPPNPARWETQVIGWTPPPVDGSRTFAAGGKPVPRPVRRTPASLNAAVEEKSIADLDAALNNPGAANDRTINVVELSRAEGAPSLMKSVFAWQRRKSARPRDIIFYVSPVNSSPTEERLIAEKVSQFIKRNSQKFRGIQGKTVFLFHSQENRGAHSLDQILASAKTHPAKTYLGLASQAIRGKIDRVFWIRTTISRWDLVPRTGIELGDQVIPANRINAFLVDPNRQLVTAIYLYPKNISPPNIKIAG